MRTVADAMTTPAPVVERSATVQDASAEMLDAGTQAAIVVDEGRVCGVATAADVTAALAEAPDAARTPIGAIVQRTAPNCAPGGSARGSPPADALRRARRGARRRREGSAHRPARGPGGRHLSMERDDGELCDRGGSCDRDARTAATG